MNQAYSSVPFTTASNAGRPKPGLRHTNIPPDGEEIHAPLVLVVDDEALVRWSVAETLAAAGYRVIEAATGHDARAALNDAGQPIVAILLDLQLPDDTGLDVLEEVRRVRRSCPVLVMTAYGSPEAVDRAMKLGALAIVPKPFDLDHLLEAVRRICPLRPPAR
jgi:DNA-binding NtrC family response regulator